MAADVGGKFEKLTYKFRNKGNRFSPGPYIGHAVDVAIEGVISGMSIK